MKSHDLFAVFLKAIGIWFVAAGIQMLPVAIQERHSYNDEVAFFYMMMNTFAAPAMMIIAGFWLFLTTNIFVKFLYPGATSKPPVERELSSQSLSSSELFAVILKLIGTWNIVLGASMLPGCFAYAHRLADKFPNFNVMLYSIGEPVVLLVAGCFFTFVTNWFTQLAFPSKAKTNFVGSSESSEDACQQLLRVILKAVGIRIFVNGVKLVPKDVAGSLYGATDSRIGTHLEAFVFPILGVICGSVLFFATEWFIRIAFAERMPLEDEMGQPPSEPEM